MDGAYECKIAHGVDQGVIVNVDMADGVDLRGLESDGPLPSDTELIVTDNGTVALCIPIQWMVEVRDKLWSIPTRKFAPDLLAGREYSICLKSESPMPATKLHYNVVLFQLGVRLSHSLVRYQKYTNVTKLNLEDGDASQFMGVYLPEHPPCDTEISLTVNGTVALKWNYTQMLLHNARTGTDILIETIPLHLKDFRFRTLRSNNPVSLYVISRQYPE
jgi:hypothetical protein